MSELITSPVSSQCILNSVDCKPIACGILDQAELAQDRKRGVVIDRRARRADNRLLAIEHSHLDALPREAERGKEADRPRADYHYVALVRDCAAHEAKAFPFLRASTRGLVSVTASAVSPPPSASPAWSQRATSRL